MFEVIVTYRTDFTEKAVERYTTEEEALAVAEHLVSEHRAQIIRAWVRHIRPVGTKP
jgi:hypothetical protein